MKDSSSRNAVARFMLLVVPLLLWLDGAQANNFVFAPSVTYLSETVRSNGVKTYDKTTKLIDYRLGYHFEHLYLGALYSTMSEDYGGPVYTSKNLGASIGFVMNGFSAIYHYLLTGEWDQGSLGKYQKGSGYQVDVSYAFVVAPNLMLGPQLSYKSFKYDELNDGNVTTKVNLERTLVLPTLNLWFTF